MIIVFLKQSLYNILVNIPHHIYQYCPNITLKGGMIMNQLIDTKPAATFADYLKDKSRFADLINYFF